jgi:hypothetical protein
LLALHVSIGSDEAQPVGSIAALVTSLWRTSLLVREQGAEQQVSEATAAQQQQQWLDSKASFHERLELLLLERLTVALLAGTLGHKGLWRDRTCASVSALKGDEPMQAMPLMCGRHT